jgi:hypothetical protein
MLKRRMILFALLVVALMALAGCGPRAGGGDAARAAGASDLVVDLPAIYVDFTEEGVGTIGGLTVSQASALIGTQLPDLALGAEAVQSLRNLNIQHIQLVNSDQGLTVFVNGARVPSLAWEEEVLNNLKDLLGNAGLDLGPISGLLPLLGTFNTGIVLRFPLAEGQETLPLVDPEAEAIAESARAAVTAFEANAGQPTVIQFSVDYTPDGSWTVEGRDAAQWEEVLPIGWDGFNLDAETIAGAVALGVDTFGVTTDEEGIQFSLNGERMPTITWGNGEISNILRLLESTGALNQMTDGNQQVAGLLDLVEQLMPTVQSADVNVTVNFPE